MTVVKYILLALMNAISFGLGGGGALDSTQYSSAEYTFINILGFIIFIILGLIHLFFGLKIFKNKYHNVLLASLCTVGIFLVFCGICILLEWIIRGF